MEAIHNKQFFHPYAHQEVNYWENFRNRIFEWLEQIYFFFVDLVTWIAGGLYNPPRAD
jgi:hypothetical protein